MFFPSKYLAFTNARAENKRISKRIVSRMLDVLCFLFFLELRGELEPEGESAHVFEPDQFTLIESTGCPEKEK